ncbi:MAG TPA: response regulator transcription factor [Opitutaceae bacterium]|nr:response regulator transcription factor [Opitutaceae bacterium]
MKLLIVDDHAGVRAMIRELAPASLADVRECATAEAALELARAYAPDVVTMDARLPGLGGIEATRNLCTLQPGVVVIVVSAFNLPAVRTAALRAGAVEFVAKDELHKLRPMIARFGATIGGGSSVPPRSDCDTGGR